MDIENDIRLFALENAIKFSGKATAGAVIGKILATHPEKKSQMKELATLVNRIIKEINSMPADGQAKLYEKIVPKERKLEKAEIQQKKKEVRSDLPPLPNAVLGKVVTRLPPEPSKYNHIGHALSFLINYMYAEKYEGKCVLKFEDTNPEKSKQEFVDAMIDDITVYLGIKPSKIVLVSDLMDVMYRKADELIKKEKAYVCFCNREKMQELRSKGENCSCCKDVQSCLSDWDKMKRGFYAEEEAILRLKGDMQADNKVMRDPVLFRICKTPHFKHKDKYSVWPLYDFENAISDCELGVTHILRSSEFGEMRNELQNFIKDNLGYPRQEIIHYGRFNITGAVTQRREIRKLIEEKKVTGWDDPSLVTLKALKRRGITSQVIRNLVFELGMSMTQKNIDWTVISSISRKLLDKEVNRYFFVDEPRKIKVAGAPQQEVAIKRHPDYPERGERRFSTWEEFYISKSDLGKMKTDDLVRLMDCLNFVKGKSSKFHSLEYERYKKDGKMIIQWLPVGQAVDVRIRMPDNQWIEGKAEPDTAKLKVGDIVQFQRFGFCRLDDKLKMEFWFTHK